MNDRDLSKDQLIAELARLRRRVAELEAAGTQQQNKEKAQESFPEHYHAVSEMVPGFAYAVRVAPDGSVTPEWLSSASTHTTGYTLDEIRALGGLPALIHPDDLPQVLEHYRTHLSGQPSVREFRILTRDGQVRWLRYHGRPVWDPAQGRVTRIYGVGTDITDLKQTEQALRESEERFRQVSASMMDIAYSCIRHPDQCCTLDWLIGATHDKLGYAVDEIMALGCWGRLVVEEDRPLFEQHVSGLQPGASGRCDLRLRKRTGDVVWVAAYAQCVSRANDPGHSRLFGALVDINARKQVEAAYLESEARYRALFEQSHDAVFILDLAGRHLETNPRATDMLGYSVEELRTLSMRDLSAEVTESEHILERLLAGQRVLPYERRFQHKSGQIVPVEINAALVRDAAGRPRHIQSAVRDITERRRMEEALRQRTLELQASNADLEAYASAVAHDLRNPLSTLIGFAEALLVQYEALPVPDVKEALETIARSAWKLDTIIKDLLLLAHASQGEVPLSPLPMGEIVPAAIQQLAPIIRAQQAAISQPSVWPVALGYAPWIEAVWVNYISNAIKYGGEPPQVELGWDDESTRERAGESADRSVAGSHVRFWVRDNGTGLRPEQQAVLFTPFTRLNQARAKGHGLGLSIVRRIVEKLGGRVGIESAVGAGSTFYFTLPLAQTAQLDVPPAASVPASTTTTTMDNAQEARTLALPDGLPSAWVADLRQAAIDCDVTWIETLIGQIEAQHPELAQSLRAMAEHFEYANILALTY